MEIALHLGAHYTDQGHVLRCLRRNEKRLAQEGIAISKAADRGWYLRTVAETLLKTEIDETLQTTILDANVDLDDPKRIIFSSPELMAMPKWAVGRGRLYPDAGVHVAGFRRLFPQARVTAYLSLVEPRELIPQLAANDSIGGFEHILRDSDPMNLRWSETVADLREAVPDMEVVVWREDQALLLWPEILREISGHAPDTELQGWFARYWGIVPPDAHAAMRQWFDNVPPGDDRHRRRVLEIFLKRFKIANSSSVEKPATWTPEVLEQLTDVFEQDLDLIGAMRGVRLIEL